MYIVLLHVVVVKAVMVVSVPGVVVVDVAPGVAMVVVRAVERNKPHIRLQRNQSTNLPKGIDKL